MGHQGEEDRHRADVGAAAERADEIMAGLSALADADDPGLLDALRAGQGELEGLRHDSPVSTGCCLSCSTTGA